MTISLWGESREVRLLSQGPLLILDLHSISHFCVWLILGLWKRRGPELAKESPSRKKKTMKKIRKNSKIRSRKRAMVRKVKMLRKLASSSQKPAISQLSAVSWRTISCPCKRPKTSWAAGKWKTARKKSSERKRSIISSTRCFWIIMSLESWLGWVILSLLCFLSQTPRASYGWISVTTT